MTLPSPQDRTVSAKPLRSPDEVMRLARMGAFYPTCLSFMRSLVRNLSAERARVCRREWQMDANGFGHAVYSLPLGGFDYSLVALSTPLEADRRTDRVIAEAWDNSYVLFDGIPAHTDIERLRANAPRQEAGRFAPRELVLSRANRSVRFFDDVVDRLAQDLQPDEKMQRSIGYLLRTTAVYGNGKFGVADREHIADRPFLSGPFAAEMLTVWLIKVFSHDLVEHITQAWGPDSWCPLDRRLKRHLGIGNSTGLGMAPFLVNHPVLLNNWMLARETALARARSVTHADPATVNRARALMQCAARHLEEWNVEDARQMTRIHEVRREWADLIAVADRRWLEVAEPWDRLIELASKYGVECGEPAVSLVLDLNGPLIDDLADQLSTRIGLKLDPGMTVGQVQQLVEEHFTWVRSIDFADQSQTSRFWYVSEEKLEPRIGERYDEPGADRESPLDIARQVAALAADVDCVEETQSVAEFLMHRPHHRHAVRRVQGTAGHPFAEIRDNLIADDCLPIDMLRCNLSFFGAAKFDSKSDRWTRINMYQGAPCFEDIVEADADDWWLPVLQ